MICKKVLHVDILALTSPDISYWVGVLVAGDFLALDSFFVLNRLETNSLVGIDLFAKDCLALSSLDVDVFVGDYPAPDSFDPFFLALRYYDVVGVLCTDNYLESIDSCSFVWSYFVVSLFVGISLAGDFLALG